MTTVTTTPKIRYFTRYDSFLQGQAQLLTSSFCATRFTYSIFPIS